jgi:hypothetical protein
LSHRASSTADSKALSARDLRRFSDEVKRPSSHSDACISIWVGSKFRRRVKERRPSLSPSIERQKLSPQSMICVEIRRRRGVWAQHPRHAQPDRPVGAIELLTRVRRRNAFAFLHLISHL